MKIKWPGDYEVTCVYESLQSFPTFCDPMDCCPPGFSVHLILQARILEWIAIPFSRRSSRPRDRTLVSCITADSLPFELQGSPWGRGRGFFQILKLSSNYTSNCLLSQQTVKKLKKIMLHIYELQAGLSQVCLNFTSLSFIVETWTMIKA